MTCPGLHHGGLTDVLVSLSLDCLLDYLNSVGINTLLPCQQTFLTSQAILSFAKNGLISFPTGSGKTLLGDLLMLSNVVRRNTSSIVILPFVALASQRMESLRPLCRLLNIPLLPFYSNLGTLPLPSQPCVVVSTIEKANSIINHFANEYSKDSQSDRSGLVGCVCVDELQLVSDGLERGALLEILIAKVLYYFSDCRIYGFSATIGNLETVAQWLQAQLFVHNERSIPLFYSILRNEKLFNDQLDCFKELDITKPITIKEQLLSLLNLHRDETCLIFVPTKKSAENFAEFLSRYCGNSTAFLPNQFEIHNQLLATVIANSVGFHHSGLCSSDKMAVEQLFLQGYLKVIVATSSLSAGVDLPCRFVIITSPFIGIRPLSRSELTQMAGRAGRSKTLHSRGDCYLIANTTTFDSICTVLNEPVGSCTSNFGICPLLLETFIAEIISNGIASSPTDLRRFIRCTLYYTCNGKESSSSLFKSTISQLIEKHIVTFDEHSAQFELTPLGFASGLSHIAPTEAVVIEKELEAARRSLCLTDDFHLCFLSSTISMNVGHLQSSDFYFAMLDEVSLFNQNRMILCEKLGVDLKLFSKIVTGKRMDLNQQKHQAVHRCILAVILNYIANEYCLKELSVKFGCSLSSLENLQETASLRASMLATFSKALNWNILSFAFSQLSKRLQTGAKDDLLDNPLLKISGLGPSRVRRLIKNSISNLDELASSDVSTLSFVLNVSHQMAESFVMDAQGMIEIQSKDL
ncbi:hypothetical protein P9112_012264 [Eukaryota sp. TZLM1-RC]